MTDLDIAILGASRIGETTGSPMWQPAMAITDDEADVEGFGECVAYQSLGFCSLPYQRTADGFAESVIARNVGGRDAICLGGRDTRSARIVGNLKPGDTVVHSTGPAQAAQLQLKEEKRQAVLATKTFGDVTMAIVLDGKNEKLQIAAQGAIWEIDQDGNCSFFNASGTGMKLQGGDLFFVGNIHFPGLPPGMALMAGPISGQTPGPLTAPLLPVAGIGQ